MATLEEGKEGGEMSNIQLLLFQSYFRGVAEDIIDLMNKSCREFDNPADKVTALFGLLTKAILNLKSDIADKEKIKDFYQELIVRQDISASDLSRHKQVVCEKLAIAELRFADPSRKMKLELNALKKSVREIEETAGGALYTIRNLAEKWEGALLECMGQKKRWWDKVDQREERDTVPWYRLNKG